MQTVDEATLGGMPEEVRQHILTHVSGPAPIEFYVVTATEQQPSVSKPIAGLNGQDVVVRGYPIGPVLYVTEVVSLVDGQPPGSAPLVESLAARALGADPNGPQASATQTVPWALEMSSTSLFELTTKMLHARSPRLGPAGRPGWPNPRESALAAELGADHFLLTTPDGRLFLNATEEEDNVTRARYDQHELSCSRITGRDMVAVRRAAKRQFENVVEDPKSSFLRIPSARAIRTGGGATKKLLQLSSTFKVTVDVPIIATLPILSKLEVPTHPLPSALREDPVMSARIGLETNKWLACIPVEWVHQQIQMNSGVESFTLADRIEAVRNKVAASALNAEPEDHQRFLRCSAGRLLPRHTPSARSRNSLAPGADGQLVMADILAHSAGDGSARIEPQEPRRHHQIAGTNFKTLAAALVCSFFDRENAVVTDITDPERVRRLLAKADRPSFQTQYGLRSSLMSAVKPGEAMRATTKERCARREGSVLKRFLTGRARAARGA
jgi:hypothetical protein